jgi:RNA polymerase sigma-70 factor (ECF subfamily)
VALSRVRVAHRRREVALDEAATQTDGIADDAIARRGELERAIRKLPAVLRAVFVLKEVEGLSHAEVAATLGIRVGTSEVRLHRALKKLRAELGGSR